MNILFLCTANLNRSRTAEDYFREHHPLGYSFKSAGLSKKECERNNTCLCTVELLEWADKIFVMEAMHKTRIAENTGLTFIDKVINLNIPDIYKYKQTELIEILIKKVSLGES